MGFQILTTHKEYAAYFINKGELTNNAAIHKRYDTVQSVSTENNCFAVCRHDVSLQLLGHLCSHCKQMGAEKAVLRAPLQWIQE